MSPVPAADRKPNALTAAPAGRLSLLSFHAAPASLLFSLALLTGIRSAELTQWPATTWMLLCGTICLVTWWPLCRNRLTCGQGSTLLLIASVCLGGLIWSVRFAVTDARSLRAHFQNSRTSMTPVTVRLNGVVKNIPSQRTRRDLAYRTPGGDSPERTVFLLQTSKVLHDNEPVRMNGVVRVLIDGHVGSTINWGDVVQVTGRLETEFLPTNPGEFDFQTFLDRQSIQGVLYVKHRAAVSVLQPNHAWHPLTILSGIRQQSVLLMRKHLNAEIRPLAEALLLGNRGHLEPDSERDFISSGTMHLLSISGLHVGILYMFLQRALHSLLVSHRSSMLVSLHFCIFYALLTDLRPSVVRATLFILFAVIGQLLNRNLRMSTVIGNTTAVLLLWNPGTAFDLGAWLSFLAVAALAWIADPPRIRSDRTAPPDGLTWPDRLQNLTAGIAARLGLRYRQMLGIAAFSMPLVASQFHVISVSGLIVNILLIPFTAVVMIGGFIFLGSGLLLPFTAGLIGMGFQVLLNSMMLIVALVSDFRLGSMTIADLPFWFLTTYYLLLFLIVASRHTGLRKVSWSLLGLLVLTGFWQLSQRTTSAELQCTVLNVGHGNAVVVEIPDGRVLLFDAGALNRADRTAELISRFLWHQGHRMIDAIVISHADIDHYNAISGLLNRMPVGQILTTREFTNSDAEPAVQLMKLLQVRSIPIQQVFHGDSVQMASTHIRFQQAVLNGTGMLDDNESSLTAYLEFAGRTIAIPGDLEKRGQDLLLPELTRADVLISPHHGSRSSNTSDTVRAFAPRTVIVSARSADNTPYLKDLYGPGTELLTTASDGAVTVRIVPDSGLSTICFVKSP